MAMYNTELQRQVKEMFQKLHIKADEIITASSKYKSASERIMNVVSSKVTAESEGYVVDLYATLVDKIKKEEYFQDPEHLNAFYRLNLRAVLNDKYHFEINSLDSYQKGIGFNEVNQLYSSAIVAAGTGAGLCAGKIGVEKLLAAALAISVNIPFVVIVAGALGAALVTHFKIVPAKNKKEYKKAVDMFLDELEKEILNWLSDIEAFFDRQVQTIYTGNR